MNAVVIAIIVMCALSLSRVSVVLSLVIAAVIGGLVAGMDLSAIMDVFNSKDGVGGGAEIALSYAILGAFALALARSGVPDVFAHKIVGMIQNDANINPKSVFKIKFILLISLLAAAMMSQNVIPVHIAFIPVLVPPLLIAMNRLQLDRRAVACVMTMGLVGTYMLIPAGFGAIFLEDLVMKQINTAAAPYHFVIEKWMMPAGMAIPVAGMFLGMLFAVFVSYRKPRQYQDMQITVQHSMREDSGASATPTVATRTIIMSLIAIVAVLVVRLQSGSMALGGLVGFAILSFAGIFKWKQSDDVFMQGMRMMALIGFIMIAASGFAAVMKATGQVDTLVSTVAAMIGGSQGMGAFLMLLVGLLVTMGIGSSFSTVPILAVLYVPLCIQLGFSPLATVAIIGTAAALGDAGSPASDSTLGPTSGLGVDGQHDHIWDTVVPTFVHFNIPLMIFGWIAAMVL
ncbi:MULTISPECIES: Na+/H+ antiporter family protein [unclassified Acinetobacter]|uniref:Na+/H+ antiporter family protein n=1 Tax=unclassified Acinetobacter TaxID=196816 RepID=UPI0035B6B21C